MQDKELSQWFDINVQKPWEPGVYEVREECDIGKKQKWYSYWNGKKFMYYTHISEHDAFEKKSQPTGCITSQWRGLAYNPAATAKPKTKGNRKVTRWLHFTGMLGSDLIHKVHGVYKTKKEAEIARDKRNSHGWRSGIKKIRFRTPEV